MQQIAITQLNPQDLKQLIKEVINEELASLWLTLTKLMIKIALTVERRPQKKS